MKVPNNKLSSVKEFFLKELHNLDASEVNQYFIILCDAWLGLSKTDLIINPEKELSESEILKFLYGIKDLKKHRPIQYVAGKTWFYGLELTVNEGCLIPRPETEELVDWVVKEEKKSKSILDIGTGSGCIPLAIKSILNSAEVSAYDISEEALAIAELNGEQLGLEVNFILSDILNWENQLLDKSFDVIISNPPYIPNSDKPQMAENVIDFEPQLALFVENETPIIFYERIADYAKKYLNDEGSLYFEIHESFGKEVMDMLKAKSFKEILLKQDLQGKDRMIKAKK